MNVEGDIAAYAARAIGDSRTLNRQMHVRPPLNSLSQHDMAYIWEDKIFRQLCIGSRLDRAFVSNADLEQRIACAPPAPDLAVILNLNLNTCALPILRFEWFKRVSMHGCIACGREHPS